MRVLFLILFIHSISLCFGQVSFRASTSAIDQLVQLEDSSYAGIGTYIYDAAGLRFSCDISRFSAKGEVMRGAGWGGYVSIIGYGYAITKTSDSGFAILGKNYHYNIMTGQSTYQLVLAKFSSNTVLQWQKNFYVNDFLSNYYNNNWDGVKLLQLKDKSYLAAIDVTSFDSTDFSCLIRTDSTGNLTSAQKLGSRRNSTGYYTNEYATGKFSGSVGISDITEDGEGYTCLMNAHSYTRDTSSSDTAWLIKMNNDNQVMWSKYIQSPAGAVINTGAASLAKAPDDSGYVLTGSIQNRPDSLTPDSLRYRRQAFVMKISNDGNVIWTKAVDTSTGDNLGFVSVKPTPDGGYICGGSLYTSHMIADTTLNCAYLLKLDANGQPVWGRGMDEIYYPGPYGQANYASMSVTDAIPTKDSGYAITSYYFAGHPHMNYYYPKRLYKLNSALQVCGGNWSYRTPFSDMALATATGTVQVIPDTIFQPITDTVNFGGGGFIDIMCADSSAVMPFRFISVRATAQNNSQAIIEWKASGEGNAGYFMVQRSDSTMQFAGVQQVKAIASNSDTLNYSITDDSLSVPGTYYYRVQMVDRDGKNTYYSPVVSVTIMPLQFVYFTTTLTPDTTVAVAWKAVYENNLSYYALQRADSTRNYASLYTIKAQNSGGQATYQFEDLHPLFGTSYYRLQKAYKNGTFAYSFADSVIIIPVQPGGSDSNRLVAGITPNLVRDMIHLNIQSQTAGTVQITVNDMWGRVVTSRKTAVVKGSNQITIPAASLQRGMFIMKIVQSDGSGNSIRFIKQ